MKTGFGNEMEIFITLTRLGSGVKMVNTASDDYLVYFHPLVQHIYEEWDITINVHR